MSSEDSVSSDSSDSEDEKKSAPGTPKSGAKGVKAATPSRKKRNDVEEEGVVRFLKKFYCPQTKLREGNFLRVSLCSRGGW